MKGQMAQKAGKAVAWKTFQHAGVKGIYFLRLLILARLLSPDDFGLLAVSMVVIDIMSRVTDLGMIPALIQREDAEDIHYDTAWTIGFLRALLISAVVYLAAPAIAHLFNEPRAAPIMKALALRPLLEAAASIKIAELTRSLRFRDLAMIRLPDALANTIVAISLAPTFGVWALVAGTLTGPLVVLVLSYVVAPYRPRLRLDHEASRSLIHFGRWIFLNGLIAVAASAVLRWVITIQLGTVELGLYFLATRLAFLPADIASQVIGEVTFPLYARLQASLKKVTRTFKSVVTGVFALLMPILALLIALTPALIALILGAKWEGTVPIIRTLACVSIIGILGETIVPILKGVGRPSRIVVIEAAQSLLLITLIWFFTDAWGLIGAALAWLPPAILAQILGVGFLREVLDHPFSGLWKSFLAILVIALAGAFVASALYGTYPGLWSLILSTAVALFSMGGALWLSDRRFGLGLQNDMALAFPQLASLVGVSKQ